MAIYHLSIKIISRGKGKSAVAAAAYRSGEKITNKYDGITHDYTRKGGIAHIEILLPDHAPEDYADRSILWSAVERIEKSKNSQLAREIEIALPRELTMEQNILLVREYCQKHFVSVGMCSDICIHDKQDGNPHAHIMLTMRPLEPDGSWGTKQKKEYILDENGDKIYDKKRRLYKCYTVQTTDWNEQTKAEEWREGWGLAVNEFLELSNIEERIDHRSYERQGVEQIPTVHIGVAASQMERREISTDRGNCNREISDINKELKQVRARINKLANWLKEAVLDDAPNLQNIISNMLSGHENETQWQKVFDLKKAVAMHDFLVLRDITTLPQLQEKVVEMRKRYSDISDKLKAKERRQKVLTEHIKQADYYLQFKEVNKQYKQQKPKKQEAFREDHRQEITLYEAAKNYLNQHMNGHKTLPIKEWKAEAAKLATESASLYRDFTQLRSEVCEVEIVQLNVEQLILEGEHKCTITKNKSVTR